MLILPGGVCTARPSTSAEVVAASIEDSLSVNAYIVTCFPPAVGQCVVPTAMASVLLPAPISMNLGLSSKSRTCFAGIPQRS